MVVDVRECTFHAVLLFNLLGAVERFFVGVVPYRDVCACFGKGLGDC